MALTAALLVAPTFAQESGEAQNLSWVTPAEGSDWSAGLPDFNPGDNVTFGTNATNESVTLDQDVQAGALTIEGDYTLNGNGTLTADAITVAEGGTLTLGKKTITSARYVRLHITKRTASGNYADGIAVAEVALFKGGEQLSWDGATATVTNYSTHPAANLINGNLNDKWMWTAGTTFSVDLTFDAGAGKTFEFDGYNLATADQNGRNPTVWELQVSNDGTSYTTVDTRTYEDEVATAWATKSWIFEAPLALSNPVFGDVAITVAEGVTVNGTLTAAGGIVGDVTFGETGTLKLTAGTFLMISGVVTAQEGGVALDTSAVMAEGYVGQTFLVAQKGLSFTGVPEGFVVNEVQMTDVLSQYILAKNAPFPWKATLTGDTTWIKATWTAANGVTVDPAQWMVTYAPSVSVELTVESETTLSDLPVAVGAITVKGTAPLTLSGGQLHTSSLTVEAGAELHTDTAQFVVTALNDETPVSVTVNGTWVMNTSSGYTLPAISGTGSIVKTGTGTLSLNSGTVVEPTLHIQAGTFSLPSTSSSGYGTVYTDVPNVIVEGGATLSVPQWATNVKDAEATFTLRNNAIFSFANGNSYDNRDIAPKFLIENDGTSPTSFRGSSNGDNTKLTGGISGKGLILFEQGGSNGYTVSGVIADGADGTLAVRVNDANTPPITFSGANTYTGGTEIMTGLTVSNADALGRGPVSIAEGGTLTVSGTTLNVYGAIKSAGTITGAIALQNGASIDASAGAVTFDTLSVAEGATIPVALPADVAVGTELATWTTGPADAAAFSADLAAGLALAVDGTTLKVVEGAPSGDLTWVTGAGDWTSGLPDYAEGVNVTFGANDVVENVVVPADTPAAGAITVSGDYALGAENFGADSLEVTADGSLTLLGQPISARYVTFMPLSTGTISEFTLYLNGKEVDLEGMTIGGVDSAVNAVDGSFGTETALTQGSFIQIDAGEGKTISFDSYNVAAGADAAKFPGGWYLLAGSTQTPNLQTDMKALVSMADEEAPVAGAYLWEKPRALSGSTGYNLAITETVTVAGTVGGNGTITAKSIAFAEGATIKPTGVGYFILTANEFTGKKELALDLSALNLPAEADPTTNVYVLITSVKTDFTFTGVPEGYRVRNLGGNGYVLTKNFTQPFSASVSGTVNWEISSGRTRITWRFPRSSGLTCVAIWRICRLL